MRGLDDRKQFLFVNNAKPILADKIRYYQDEVFTSRLRPPPMVPEIDIDQHLARVQQRGRYVDEELPADASLDIDPPAHDLGVLPERSGGPPR